jgi:hypothetical protein
MKSLGREGLGRGGRLSLREQKTSEGDMVTRKGGGGRGGERGREGGYGG